MREQSEYCARVAHRSQPLADFEHRMPLHEWLPQYIVADQRLAHCPFHRHSNETTVFRRGSNQKEDGVSPLVICCGALHHASRIRPLMRASRCIMGRAAISYAAHPSVSNHRAARGFKSEAVATRPVCTSRRVHQLLTLDLARSRIFFFDDASRECALPDGRHILL